LTDNRGEDYEVLCPYCGDETADLGGGHYICKGEGGYRFTIDNPEAWLAEQQLGELERAAERAWEARNDR